MNKIIFRASLFGIRVIKAFHRKMGCSISDHATALLQFFFGLLWTCPFIFCSLTAKLFHHWLQSSSKFQLED